jgi:capsular polysaccharide biosynthesis protein
VDFWDITKLLARRWLVVLPLLLVAAALTALAMAQVKPDYTATAYVQLVPPVMGASMPGQATADESNPWLGLGVQTLGNAAIVTVTDPGVTDQLHAAGYSDSYTVTIAESSPLITFEVVGRSPEQARQTAEQLIDRLDKSVATLQTTYGVTEADSIVTHRLDVRPSVKRSTGKVKRALVAAGGAGLLVVIAATVGIDAWLRRRQRRREPTQDTSSSLQTAVVTVSGNGAGRSEPHLVSMTSSVSNAPRVGNSGDDDGGLAN